jgi:feruloyl-CoA synthase
MIASDRTRAPRSAAFAPAGAQLFREGTSEVVRCCERLRRRFDSVLEMFMDSAERHPDRVFLREAAGSSWKELRYGEALAQLPHVAAALLELGASQERPVAILSGNSIDHAVLTLGAYAARVPVAPISVAYSQFQDLTRLHEILKALTPAVVYAADETGFTRALDLARDSGARVLAGGHAVPDLARHRVSNDVADLPREGDTAKILFTSGSTGTPKGVVVTHGMMASNQDALAQLWPFLESRAPLVTDWLPWNHVFGGCLIFNCIMRNAGTLTIDGGKPLPGQFARTVETLKKFPPTLYMGVPRALNELVRTFESDPGFAATFFGGMDAMFSAGASLPRETWDALRQWCMESTGKELPLFIGWGATETAPLVSLTRPNATRNDSIGLPVPGAEIKLVPNQDKMELRVRGPMVTPGYWRAPELTARAFDDEGYYSIGDAGALRPNWGEDGITFDGRVAENFKLSSGTWVSVGAMRLAAIAAGAPVIEEVVVTGQDRDELGLLVFPNLAGCRSIAGLPDASLSELVRHPAVRAVVQKALSTLGASGGSSVKPSRALMLDEPPSMESGEMTDKGYLNQRAALKRREAQVKQLYEEPPPVALITPRNTSISSFSIP